MGRGTKTQGIVLRSRPYREADRIAVVLTRDLGKLDVLVGGARKVRSRLRALILPFTESELWIASTRGGNLTVLTGGRPTTRFVEIETVGEPEVLGIASQILELADRFVPHADPAPMTYELCRAGLHAVGHATARNQFQDARQALAAFTLKLMAFTGFRVLLWRCVRCGGEKDLDGFDVHAGGAVCGVCGGAKEGSQMLAELQRIEQLRFVDIPRSVALAPPERVLPIVRSLAENILEAPLRTQRFLAAVPA